MIGGMSLPTRTELGEQYFDAAHLLVDSIRKNVWPDYQLVNPALFLYRHALELLIKGITGTQERTHDLRRLAECLDDFARKRGQAAFPPWVAARLGELASIDPHSTAFRYAANFDRKAKRHVPVNGEVYVNLNHLQSSMLALYSAISGSLPEIARSYPLERRTSKDD
jgi:hypothetical protein